jgi:predicted glycosyltransferase
MGNFSELEHKYGLVHSYSDTGQALKKAVELLENKDAKKEWRVRREQLLDDKIDVTSFMVRFIESYPEKVKDSDSGP